MSRAYTVTARHRYATCRLHKRLRDRNRSGSQGWMLSDTQRPVHMSPGFSEFELRRTVMRITSWTSRYRDTATFIWKVKLLQRVYLPGKAAGIPPYCNPVLDQPRPALPLRQGKFQFTVEATSTSMKSPHMPPARLAQLKDFQAILNSTLHGEHRKRIKPFRNVIQQLSLTKPACCRQPLV